MSHFTKQAIKESFLKIAAKKPIRKITVRDVVEDCGLNRNTFYYYFSDIYALLEDLLVSETERAVRACRETESIGEGFAVLFGWIEENYDAFRNIYTEIGRDSVEYVISKVFDREILAYVKRCAKGIYVNGTDLLLVTGVIRSIYFGALSDHLRHNMHMDPRAYAMRVERMFKNSIPESLQVAATLPPPETEEEKS